MSALDLVWKDRSALIVWDGERAGGLRITDDAAFVALAFGLPTPVSHELLRRLRDEGVTRLDTRELPLRHAARVAGWTGGLREQLAYADATPVSFADEVQALLPAVDVDLAPHRSRLRRAVASAVAGVAGMTRLRVTPPEGVAVEVQLPDRDDVMGEAVACAIDTTLALHRRFGDAANYVRSISFDQAHHGMAEGHVGGVAPHVRGEFHLNASYAVADQQIKRALHGLRFAPPALHLDGVVAHEMWHKVELAWEASAFADTIEFRKDVGALFGVPTIEQVFTDDRAREQLATQVSNYATTNRLEATAEMFEFVWCGSAKPRPVVGGFAAIVDRYFPPPEAAS